MSDAADRETPMTGNYVIVVALEIVVLIGLWTLGQYFSPVAWQ